MRPEKQPPVSAGEKRRRFLPSAHPQGASPAALGIPPPVPPLGPDPEARRVARSAGASLGPRGLLLLVLDPRAGAGEAVDEHHRGQLQEDPGDEHDEGDHEDGEGRLRLAVRVRHLDRAVPGVAACGPRQSRPAACSAGGEMDGRFDAADGLTGDAEEGDEGPVEGLEMGRESVAEEGDRHDRNCAAVGALFDLWGRKRQVLILLSTQAGFYACGNHGFESAGPPAMPNTPCRSRFASPARPALSRSHTAPRIPIPSPALQRAHTERREAGRNDDSSGQVPPTARRLTETRRRLAATRRRSRVSVAPCPAPAWIGSHLRPTSYL